MTKSTKIIVAIGVLIVAAVVGYSVLGIVSPKPSVKGSDIVEPYPSYWSNGINIGSRYLTHVTLKMGDGQNQAFWKNTTGQNVYVSGFISQLVSSAKTTTPIASSTEALFGATSTASTITDSATPFSYSGFIDTALIATSTAQYVIITADNKGTNGHSTVLLKPNDYLLLALENPYIQSCTGATCETATSTNRGYNINASFSVSYPNQ